MVSSGQTEVLDQLKGGRPGKVGRGSPRQAHLHATVPVPSPADGHHQPLQPQVRPRGGRSWAQRRGQPTTTRTSPGRCRGPGQSHPPAAGGARPGEVMAGGWGGCTGPGGLGAALKGLPPLLRCFLLGEIEKEEKEKVWYYAQLQSLATRLDELPHVETVSGGHPGTPLGSRVRAGRCPPHTVVPPHSAPPQFSMQMDLIRQQLEFEAQHIRSLMEERFGTADEMVQRAQVGGGGSRPFPSSHLPSCAWGGPAAPSQQTQPCVPPLHPVPRILAPSPLHPVPCNLTPGTVQPCTQVCAPSSLHPAPCTLAPAPCTIAPSSLHSRTQLLSPLHQPLAPLHPATRTQLLARLHHLCALSHPAPCAVTPGSEGAGGPGVGGRSQPSLTPALPPPPDPGIPAGADRQRADGGAGQGAAAGAAGSGDGAGVDGAWGGWRNGEPGAAPPSPPPLSPPCPSHPPARHSRGFVWLGHREMGSCHGDEK